MLKIFHLLIATCIISGCINKSDNIEATQEAEKNFARLKTVHGDIIFKFESEKAPVTSSRIKQLIEQGFYNGLSFHRVEKDFIIQAGDPTGTGSGGSGQKIKAEINSLKHGPGTVAMARKSEEINSADSQFYISLTFAPELDGKYTVFAQVTEGLDVARKIKKDDKIIFMSLE